MGQIAITAAAILATTAIVLGRIRPTQHLERRLQRASLAAVALAMGHASWLLATQDTSYRLVVDHTRPGLGLVRRVMGLWGGSAGSLLFFTFVLGIVLVTAPVVDRLRAAPSVVLAGLAATSAFASPAFERLDNPAIAGSGLTPILEHWAMIIHPPLLYVGLGLSLVPLLVAPADRRRYVMVAISVLTVALALGGAWAYVELGWGGWYAWDPVENAALIPWMLLVVCVHLPSEHAVARAMSALVWPTVFCGTAMTRTSLRTSVHSFANSDGLGWYLWPLAIITTIGALFAITHDSLKPEHRIARSKLQRTVMVRRLVPVVVVGYSAMVVALGTFRPFLPGEATDGSFYARFLFPAAIVGLLALGIAPRRNAATTRLTIEAFVGGIAGTALAASTGTTDWWQLVFAAALGIALATTIGDGVRPLRRTVAHIGMVLVLAGALGGTTSTSQTFPLEQDSSITIDGHTITNRGIEFVDGPAPLITANVTVDDHALRPALTVYPERALRLPEVATQRWLHKDVQLIIRNADDDGSVVLTANVEPFAQFVWLGATLIAAAALSGVTRTASRDEPSEVR